MLTEIMGSKNNGGQVTADPETQISLVNTKTES